MNAKFSNAILMIALWMGVLLTAFLWEFWSFYAYPKWIYIVSFVNFWYIFEMPLLRNRD